MNGFTDEISKVVGCFCVAVIAAVLLIGIAIGNGCAHNPYRLKIEKVNR